MSNGINTKEMRLQEKIYKANEEANNVLNSKAKLKNLMFTDEEINMTAQLIRNGYKLTQQVLGGIGINAEMAARLKYCYDIATDKIVVSSKDDLCKHLKRMFGKHKKIGINDLALSKVSKVPRKAIVGGIKDQTFGIYNSNRYQGADKMYDVMDVSGRRITIRTVKRPIIKKGGSKKVDGVIEIKEILPDKTLKVSVDKKYIRMCNRFIVVASLRKPEYHHGLIEIICKEGTKVYVYATTMSKGDKPNYRGGSQRVYCYGFHKQEIKGKLVDTASALYRYVGGIYKSLEPPNSDFVSINPEKTEEENYYEDTVADEDG